MAGAIVAGAILVGIGALHLVYTYAAYPWLMSRLPRRPPRPGPDQAPQLVSIVIAARVAPGQVEGLLQKVEDLLATVQLPCEVVVAADGPAPELMRGLAAMGDSRIRVVNVPEGAGKAVA